MKNTEIAIIFCNIANILSLKEENPFKIRAYEKAAQMIEELPFEIEKFFKEGTLENLPDIGKGISCKIKELLETGKLKYYEELKKEFPIGLFELLSIPQIGPKTAKVLYQKLGVTNLEELEQAVLTHKIKNLSGLGEKSEENILQGLKFIKQKKGKFLLEEAMNLAISVIEYLEKLPQVEKISLAGSLRRMKEEIKNIDILVASSFPLLVMNAFMKFPKVSQILTSDKTKSSVIIAEKIEVDLQIVNNESFGSALMYFTGSKSHNIKLHTLANNKGFRMNEYGLFELNTEKKVAGKTEEEVFEKLKICYIPPELREDRGEIEKSLEQKLPSLIKLNDIKGDLHLHSNWSDGSSTIEELMEIAYNMSYQYFAICDHSQSLKIARGLSEEKLLEQIKKINELNKKNKNLKILAGVEVDILADGCLDYKDEILAQLDIVIAAIHTGFKQEIKTMTNRIIKAMNNKYVNIIAHPTGRLIHRREPYQVDLLRIVEEAKNTGTFLELNAYPERLDINEINCRLSSENGVKISIGTDSHFKSQLSYIQFGVGTARRGWLEKKDVINTFEINELLKMLKMKRN